MPRSSSRPRTSTRVALRALATTVTTMVLVAMTALPALAASAATKPSAEADPYLVGSLQQLGTAAIVGAVIAIIAWVSMAPAKPEPEDAHH